MNADPNAVRVRLAVIKHIDGVDYATAKRIARNLPWSTKELIPALRVLTERGDLVVHSDGGTRATYHITLDGPPEPIQKERES